MASPTSYLATGISVTYGTLDAELLDVDYGGEKADVQDVSHQGITDDYKKFKAGLIDGGELTLLLHFDPDAVVPAMKYSGPLTITWPTGATKKFEATAILTGKGASAKLGEKMTMPLTVKIDGAPNWAKTAT